MKSKAERIAEAKRVYWETLNTARAIYDALVAPSEAILRDAQEAYDKADFDASHAMDRAQRDASVGLSDALKAIDEEGEQQ